MGYWGCTSGTQPEEALAYPDKNLSFSRHIHPIFLSDCAAEEGCHRSAQPAAELDLETATPTFVGRSGLVVIPKAPDHSLLYQLLLENVGNTPRMPLQRGQLPENKIRAIRNWIQEGANTQN